MPFAFSSNVRANWRLAQRTMLAGTVAFVVLMLFQPTFALRLFWGVVVPILPLTFFVSPLLWRGVCPLATLNVLVHREHGPHQPHQVNRWSGATAIGALLLLVPARHVAFNTSSVAVLALVGGAAVAAVVFGRRFEARAGFCNALCPILPVERLYGMQPLLQLDSPHCSDCKVCTPRGCIDLAGSKVASQILGRRRHTREWIFTAFGAFTASFPGFVIGYFTIGDLELAQAGHVYAHMLAYAVSSFVVVTTLVVGARVPSASALPILAALSGGCYYWFAIPALLKSVGLVSPVAGDAGRALMGACLGWWLWRALQQGGRGSPRADGSPTRALPVLSID